MVENEIFGHSIDTTNNFSMIAEDVFSIEGRGTVITGRVRTGRLNIEADPNILICNSGWCYETTALGIEMFRKLLDCCENGDKIGLLVPEAEASNIKKGTLICSTDFPFSVRGQYYHRSLMTDSFKFNDIPYHTRQFIFIVRDEDQIGMCYDNTNTINFIFSCNNVPKDIFFPFGHPQPNTLYYAHPLRPYYLPVEEANLILFYEKIQEMSRLMQCLGATKVTLRCLKGNSIAEGSWKSKGIDVGGSYMQYNIDGGFKSVTSYQSSKTQENEMSETKHFNPTKLPYCPEDLVWAAADPELNSLVKQRLEGGLLNFSKRVSTREIMNVSTSRMTDVKAAFSYIAAKVSANYNSENDATFSESNETLWEISADFKPLNELEVFVVSDIIPDKQIILQNNVLSITSAEQEYIDEYRECLNNGEISYSVRRLLNKLGLRLGLSPERITELEKNIRPVLTDEEKEYLNEYHFCIKEDGEISGSSRRLLDRLAQSLNLSSEKITFLENLDYF